MKLNTLGPFIRAKISRGLNKPRLKLNKSRTTRINSQFAISRGLFRPSFQAWAYFSRGLLQIDCLYESFATYLSRRLFRPRLIFARINGPIVQLSRPSQDVGTFLDQILTSMSELYNDVCTTSPTNRSLRLSMPVKTKPISKKIRQMKDINLIGLGLQ